MEAVEKPMHWNVYKDGILIYTATTEKAAQEVVAVHLKDIDRVPTMLVVPVIEQES